VYQFSFSFSSFIAFGVQYVTIAKTVNKCKACMEKKLRGTKSSHITRPRQKQQHTKLLAALEE